MTDESERGDSHGNVDIHRHDAGRLESVSGPHAGQPLVTAGAPALAAEGTLVLCHGRGATAQGVVNLFEPASRHGVAVLAPQAERSRWYPNPATAPRVDNEPWLTSSVDCVAAALEAAREIGVLPCHTVLAGFSQGACVAAEFVRRNPQRYGGLCCLSGALPGGPDDDLSIEDDGDSDDSDDALEGTPILVGFGDDDSHVDTNRIDATVRAFEAAGGVVDERAYADIGHEVTDDEFDAIGALLERVLANGN